MQTCSKRGPTRGIVLGLRPAAAAAHFSLETSVSRMTAPLALRQNTNDLSTAAARLVDASRAMRQVRALATRAAAGDAKVFITGESGVGKDVVAQYIHAHSSRAARPFIAVNCAAIADTLLETELFGHARGSFTGAYRDAWAGSRPRTAARSSWTKSPR